MNDHELSLAIVLVALLVFAGIVIFAVSFDLHRLADALQAVTK